MHIREITREDNAIIAGIIRKSLEAHNLGIPGTVYTDPSTDHLYELFRTKGSVYFIAEENGKILGGCGIFPTEGLSPGSAELVKLYLDLGSRGKGLGFQLMSRSIQWARENGYTHLYLETKAELGSAVTLYQNLGFKNLTAPMGNSGHHACEIWMLKKLGEFETKSFRTNDPLYHESLAIRKEVFIGEQKIDPALEIEFEEESVYFLTKVDQIPAATGRLRVSGEKIKFERIASRKIFRGSGAARELMKVMLEFARKNFPGKTPYMHAQLDAAGFYEKLGWNRVGDIFHEADIPHIAMKT